MRAFARGTRRTIYHGQNTTECSDADPHPKCQTSSGTQPLPRCSATWRIAVGGGENCRQDVGASKSRQRRAIENRQGEKPQCCGTSMQQLQQRGR